jgi:hypothetical protein
MALKSVEERLRETADSAAIGPADDALPKRSQQRAGVSEMEEAAAKLIERITRLEHQQAELRRANRWLRLVTGGVMLFTGVIVLTGQTSRVPSQTVEAEQFVLRGSDGKVRGAMGIADDGAVGINLNDAKGQTRITVDLAADGSPGLDLYDPSGKMRATLALGPAGTPGLGLYDPSGKLRTSLDVPAPETPGLAFYHRDGKPAWGAP